MGIRYLPAVDGLRAVAVLAVVAYHAGLPGSGYVGVDVFFVISGYLITRLLKEDGDLVSFYARRARRILPAAILVVLATLGLSALLLPSSGDVARSASAAAVFGANFWFQSATTDYWASSAEQMPLLHLWSLSVEEQFYLLWPFVLLLPKRSLWWVFAGSLVLYAALSYWNPSAAFYQMPARAWELAAGGLVALTGTSERLGELGVGFKADCGGPREQVIVGAGTAVGGGGQVVQHANHILLRVRNHLFRRVVEHGRPDDLIRLAAVTTQAANLEGVERDDPPRHAERAEEAVLHILEHSHPRARLNGPAILRNLRTFVLERGSHIGLAVIGMALLPLPVYFAQPLAVLGATLVIASVHAGHRSVLEARPLVWVGLISYSLYLWHWPLLAIDRATRVGDAPLTVRLALCAIAFVLAALTYRYVETPFRRSRGRPVRAVAAGVACAAFLSCAAFVMADTRPVVKSADLRCGAGQMQAPHCVSGPLVALWGDSFGDAWRPYVMGVARERGLPAVRLGRSGCPPTLAPTKIRGMQAEDVKCGENTREAFDYLRTHEVDTLVVTARWSRLDAQGRAGVVEWAKALSNVRRIVVVGAQPELRDDIEKCLRLGVPCDISRAEYDSATAGTKRMTAELATLSNVQILELGDWMCDADKCPGVRRGMVLYRKDNHHASDEAVAAFLTEKRGSPLSNR